MSKNQHYFYFNVYSRYKYRKDDDEFNYLCDRGRTRIIWGDGGDSHHPLNWCQSYFINKIKIKKREECTVTISKDTIESIIDDLSKMTDKESAESYGIEFEKWFIHGEISYGRVNKETDEWIVNWVLGQIQRMKDAFGGYLLNKVDFEKEDVDFSTIII